MRNACNALQPNIAHSTRNSIAGDSSSEGSSHGGEANARVPLPLSTGADLQELLEQAAQQYQYRHWGGLGDEAAQLPVGFADLNPAAPSPVEAAEAHGEEAGRLNMVAGRLCHLAAGKLAGVRPAAGSSASQGASQGATSATTCSLEDWLGL
ncbi:hypothetical protein HaLaN_26429 [Haematococcus lacustris]|uniref:Uncharacterized protein n=1 Tax=Haematococcus lacustris TaxID=44745 RepID=A0A6A0A675_HAELA|nr:hypothetical protein HaLaN_26429 [Haematococcus lacustris]